MKSVISYNTLVNIIKILFRKELIYLEFGGEIYTPGNEFDFIYYDSELIKENNDLKFIHILLFFVLITTMYRKKFNCVLTVNKNNIYNYEYLNCNGLEYFVIEVHFSYIDDHSKYINSTIRLFINESDINEIKYQLSSFNFYDTQEFLKCLN